MSLPPLTVSDLSILLAISAILLLITAEILPYIVGQKTLLSEIKKLRTLAILIGVLFLVSIAITIYNLISSP
jgi:hypothetical protein